MLKRILLLIALFTGLSLTVLQAQNNVHVHGTVTDANGAPQDSVNILVTALYSDSNGVFQSLYTFNGTYEFDFAGPPLNVLGNVWISMVDCNGTLITQTFTLTNNGPSDIEADFVYCEQILIDSCVVIILEEFNPGTAYHLLAWTPDSMNTQYIWSTGETTQIIYPVTDGQYCVTVSFPSGCTASDCFDVNIDSSGTCFNYIINTVNSDSTYNLEAIVYGTAPYTYQWSTGETTQTITNVSPGTYCVTTTNADSCVYASCIIVDNFNFCQVLINGDPNGGLTADGTGQQPLSFVWNTGDSSQTIFPLQPGVYCVTMVDNSGCFAYGCYQYGIFPDSCSVFVNAFFVDSNTVALQAVVSTFGSNIQYLWSTGETTDVIYVTDPASEYCVTTTDDVGCVATACYNSSNWCYAWVDVQYIDTTTAVLSVYNDPIFGGGGMNSATYLWSNGETNPVITVGASGEYCVTATLGANCVTEACVYVDFDSLQFSCSAWVNQYQDSSGQWYAEAWAWGLGTFSFLWSNGDTNSITLLSNPNEFLCVTATSSFGCSAEACVDTFFNPCQVYISTLYTSNNEALLTAYPYFGPAQNAQYQWSNGETGQSITVTTEGTYCVTIYAGGCTSQACVDILFYNVDSCGVWISVDENPLGFLYTANSWGVSPFTYLWSNGSTLQSQILDSITIPLCVTVTDGVGCVSTACAYDTIIPNNGFNVISGYVFADSVTQVQGIVYAYGVDANGNGPFVLIDSALIGAQGFYQFPPLGDGVYILKAELAPGSPGSDEFIPTYHVSSTTWEEADRHILPNWLPVTTDIWMKHIGGSPGAGVIGGVVSDPQHIIANAGDISRGDIGLPHVLVLLKNEAGVAINFTFSNEDGGFRFTNLALGTYRISYDIPGIHSPDVWVTLTSENPERLQVTLVVNQGTTSVDQPVQQELSLYPNPAKTEINIIMPEVQSTYSIQIVDMQGRIVNIGSDKSNDGILNINVAHLSPGLYHLNLKGDNQIYYSRFLKLE
jgi:hypothetical protein